jgi:phage-related protein
MQSKLAKELKAERKIREAQEQVAQQQRLEFDDIRKQLEVSDRILMNSLSQTPIQLDMQSKLAEELKAEREVHEAQE